MEDGGGSIVVVGGAVVVWMEWNKRHNLTIVKETITERISFGGGGREGDTTR
jgi:hypothetical protein